jgi:Na+-driven multidrug efflux pump
VALWSAGLVSALVTVVVLALHGKLGYLFTHDEAVVSKVAEILLVLTAFFIPDGLQVSPGTF